MWTDKTFAQMVNDTPEINAGFHKDHYRNLSNFAHPTMDSFLLNRRGDKPEFSMILNTNLLTVRTILEIVKICFEQNLYFDDNQKSKINIAALFLVADNIMKELLVK